MKTIILIFLLSTVSKNSIACSCWRFGDEIQNNSFLAEVVSGDAIHPISEDDRKIWEENGRLLTKMKVIDPLGTKLKVDQEITIDQSYGFCSEFFFPKAVYKIEGQAESGTVKGSTCSIHLRDTTNVPRSIDPELLRLGEELSELERGSQ